MSDDTEDYNWGAANKGATLPANPHATHDVELSPLFLDRVGYVELTNVITKLPTYVTPYRCEQGYASSRSSTNATYSYYAGFTLNILLPSSHAGDTTHGFPLRCLVSTNNG